MALKANLPLLPWRIGVARTTSKEIAIFIPVSAIDVSRDRLAISELAAHGLTQRHRHKWGRCGWRCQRGHCTSPMKSTGTLHFAGNGCTSGDTAHRGTAGKATGTLHFGGLRGGTTKGECPLAVSSSGGVNQSSGGF